AGVTATGETTTVEVSADDMRFTPSVLEVPLGNRLVIDLTNTATEDVHDLVLDDGTDSGRLAPGQRVRLEVPVVGRDVEGWCSIVGHRQLGMTLRIEAVGASANAPQDAPHGETHGGAPGEGSAHDASGESAVVDPQAVPDDDFRAHDPSL